LSDLPITEIQASVNPLFARLHSHHRLKHVLRGLFREMEEEHRKKTEFGKFSGRRKTKSPERIQNDTHRAFYTSASLPNLA